MTAALLHTLPNGVRVLALPQPWRQGVNLSVFVASGSLHEPRRLNGISHVVEHMAFKGTVRRDNASINLDAERLGADVNAHTDKDHTAFHIDGLGRDLPAFVELLSDIVLHSTFPEVELERERQVIRHEFTEFDDDPATTAFNVFDRACWGWHPLAQPVIGRRANLERFTGDDLRGWVAQQYVPGRVMVAAVGGLDASAFVRAAEAGFGALRGAALPVPAPPSWLGGIKLRRLSGSSQCHVIVGHAAPPLADPAHHAWRLAAAVLGEGMSSPLLDRLRERRGLAYHAACSADIGPLAGQFVVEAATAPEQAVEVLDEIAALLAAHAERVSPVDLERAREQLVVRALRTPEQPVRLLETTVQEVFALGRPADPASAMARLRALTADDVRAVFRQMQAAVPAVALAGQVPAAVRLRAQALFGNCQNPHEEDPEGDTP
ncbi:MAG: insulinase family protein [Rubrivivax sp.]|nr:insulinase family protein [Rubrivivax sp.]